MIEVEANILVEKTSKPIVWILWSVIGVLSLTWVLIEQYNDIPEPRANKMVFTMKK